MAEVWKARVQGPAGFSKIVAIKRILPDMDEHSNMVQMFIEEAKLVARLQHPNIVQVFDFGALRDIDGDELDEDGGDYFIAMEYVAGHNLAKVVNRLRRRGANLSLDIALLVTAETARGLSYAHFGTEANHSVARIVHRDLSPHNVLVSYSGAVKIVDFGIAKVTNALSKTMTGQLKGKLAYLSPEQLKDARSVDHRTDLFTLGCVLYELITGNVLFAADDAAQILELIRQWDPYTDPKITSLPREVIPILQRALAADPARRYQDAQQMEAELTTVLGTDRLLMSRRSLVSLMRTVFKKEFARERREEQDLDAVDSLPGVSEDGPSTNPTKAGVSETVAQALPSLPDTTHFSGRSKARAENVTMISMDSFFESSKSEEPLPDPFAEGAGDAVPLASPGTTGAPAPAPWAQDSKTLNTAGASCRSCSSVVEAFLGDSDLCFACLDEEESNRLPDTSYQAEARPTQLGENEVDETDMIHGWVSVQASSTVEVWIDGARVTSTPVSKHRIEAGRHTFTFVSGGFRSEESLIVPSGTETTLFVDVKNRVVQRW